MTFTVTPQGVVTTEAGHLAVGNYALSGTNTLTFDYTRGPIGVTARFNHYGAWRTADGLFGSGNPPLDAYTYSARTLLDLEARYQFTDVVSVAVGGTNVFNSFPDKEQNSTLRFLGVNYAVTSPFGFNGAFWYARLTAKF